MTQKALAEALGVSAAALVQWEKGRRAFPPGRLERVAEVLGLPIGDLAMDDLPIPPKDSGRRPVLRPQYPPGATLEQVAALGKHQREVHGAVKAHLSDAMYRVVAEDLPRDTVHELLVAMKFLAADSLVELSSPGQYQCPEHTMHDLDGSVGDHLLQPVIVWEKGDERIVLFSQVWLNVTRYGPIRVDFLACYRRKEQRGYWFPIEIDDRSSHEEKKYRDEARALALSTPVLRYENHMVHQAWFLSRLLEDIRELAPEAARRRRDRLIRARRFERSRRERAARRRTG